MTRRRNHGDLSDDDQALWSHVVRTVHPLRHPARRVRPLEMPEPSTDQASAAAPRRAGSPASGPPDPRPSGVDLTPLGPVSPDKPRWHHLQPKVTSRPRSSPATATFDKRHARKIASGKVEIEGRLDLHGLKEHEAHVRLRGFLRQAQAQGKRTVLVITGKGRDTDDPHAPFDYGHDRAPRGVLKRNVPRWLAEPDLAPLIVSFTTAHARHGGEGALYVHLRRA